MKRTLSLILLLILIVVSLVFAGINGFSERSSTGSTSKSEQQPQVSEVLDVVTEYYEAVNAGDVEHLEELFADDIVIDYPRVDLYGKDDAIKLYRNMASRNESVTSSEAVVEGDVVRSRHRVINEAGDELTGDIIITVKDDKICKISVVWDEESMEKIERQAPPTEAAEPPPSEETPQASLAEVEIPVENVDAIIDGVYFEPETTGKRAVGRLDWRNTGDAIHNFNLSFYMVTQDGARYGPVQVNNDVQSASPWVTNRTALQLSFEELPAGTYGVAADICDAQTGEVVASRTFSGILSLEAPAETEQSQAAAPASAAPASTAPAQYYLQTGVNPPGSGTVSHRTGAYNSGNILNLTATPAENYQFVSWSGDVQNTNNQITITMNRNYNVQANFEPVPAPEPSQPPQYIIRAIVEPRGSGSVGYGIGSPGEATVGPSGVTVVSGLEVILTATPSQGYQFSSWAGDVRSRNNQITLTMNRDYSVQANFASITQPADTPPGTRPAPVQPPPDTGSGDTRPPPASRPAPSTYTLTLTKSGAGDGTVTGQGINCGTDCSEEYTSGTSVKLTAAAGGGSAFSSWSGCDSSSDSSCTVLMNQDRAVTATFGLTISPPPIRKPDKTSPTVLRIINDLYDQSDSYADWGKLNNIISVRIGPTQQAVLYSTAGEVLSRSSYAYELEDATAIPPAYNSVRRYKEFDVSNIELGPDGGYWVLVQAGWWDSIFDTRTFEFRRYEKRATVVLDCKGNCCIDKWATFQIIPPFYNPEEIRVSEYLPQTHWHRSSFCGR